MTIMKSGSKVFLLSIAAAMTFSACGGGGGGGSSSGTTGTTVSGVASNLPFKKGATVTCSQIDSTGSVGTSVSTTTSDDNGNYTCSGVTWTGPTKIAVSGDMPDVVRGGNFTTSGSASAIFSMGSTAKTANTTTLTTMAAAKIEQGIVSAISSGSSAINALIESSSNSILQQIFGSSTSLPTGVALEDLNPMASSSTNAVVNLLNAALLVFDVKLDTEALNSGITPIQKLTTIRNDFVQGNTITLPTVTITQNDLSKTLASFGSSSFTTTNATIVNNVASNNSFVLTATTFAAAASSSGSTFPPTVAITSGQLTQSGSVVNLSVGQVGASNVGFTLAGTDGRSGTIAFSGSSVTSNTVTVTSGVSPASGIVMTYTPTSAQSATAGLVTVTATSKSDSSKVGTLVIPYTALGANRVPSAKGGSFNTPGQLVLNLASSSVTADADNDTLTYHISAMTSVSGFTPTFGFGAGFSSTSSWTNSGGLTFTGFEYGLSSTGIANSMVSSGNNLSFTGSTKVIDTTLGTLSLDKGTGKVTYTRNGYGTNAGISHTGTFGFGYAVIDSKGYGRIERVYIGVSQNYSTTSAP